MYHRRRGDALKTKFLIFANITDKNYVPLRDTTPEFDEGDSEDELLEDMEEDGVVQVQGVDPDESKILPQSAIEREQEDLKM